MIEHDVCIPILFAGRSSSGKSTLVKKMQEEIGAEFVTIISGDNYYKDVSHLQGKELDDYDFDDPFNALNTELLLEHIKMIKEGKTIHVPNYSFIERRPIGSMEIQPRRLVFIDSVLAFAIEKIMSEIPCSIFVTLPSDQCLMRRIFRDIGKDGQGGRGWDMSQVYDRWKRFVEPAYRLHIKPRVKYASMLIPGDFRPMHVKLASGALIYSHIPNYEKPKNQLG